MIKECAGGTRLQDPVDRWKTK